MKKKSWKLILILALVVVLAAGSVGGYFALAHQNASQILDHTQGGKPAGKDEGKKPEGGSSGDFPEEFALNASVAVFDKKDNDAINDAILSLESVSTGVEMEIQNGTAMKDLGVGDIFFLGGDEQTPFGMTYIGKISAIMPGDSTTTYVLKTPGIDEVFDVLRFSEDGMLKPENLVSVDCAPGVTLASKAQQASGLTQTGKGSYGVVPLSGGTVVNTEEEDAVSGEVGAELLFNIEVDILDLYKKLSKKDDKEEEKNETEFMAAGSVEVAIADKMPYYHKDMSCEHIQDKKNKRMVKLPEAVEKKKAACNYCKPPVIGEDGGVAEFAPSVKLTGEFGLKDVTFSATCNWDLVDGNGLQDLYFDVNGTLSADVNLFGGVEGELKGRTTVVSLFDNSILFEGMNEHLVPLAAVHYAVGGSFTPIVNLDGKANEHIRQYTLPSILSVVGIVYFDAEGNFQAGFSANFNYKKDFEYQKDIVRAGKFTFDSTYNEDPPKVTFGAELHLSADLDACLGAGLDLYIFNLKVAQLDIVQFGAEGSGKLEVAYNNQVAAGEEEAFSWDAHIRVYLKLLNLELGFHAKENVIPLVDLSFDLSADFCLLDHTVWEWGKPSGTRYDPATMAYNHVTARDSDAIYYKDTAGQLVKVQDDTKKVLHTEKFFTICGIDETYIYVLESGESYTHNIRRIAKNGSTSKVMVTDVKQFLTIDEEYTYYVPNFDQTSIRRLNRGDGDLETFANYSKPVIRMVPQGDDFYVAAGQGSSLGYFSGDYMLVDKNGNTKANYGGNPSVSQMEQQEFENYKVARQIVSTGYLRDTAASVHWVGANGGSLEIDPVTGWNYFEGGIITMERSDSGYNIVLYRAADGVKVTLGAAAHDHALFTAAQDDRGRWFYVDQTDSQILLNFVSPSLTGAKKLTAIPKSQFPVDLSQCSVVLQDNKLFFYTISGSSSCDVLHIFNLY